MSTGIDGAQAEAAARRRWIWPLLLFCSLAPYVNALRAGFVFDDQMLVVQPLAKAGPFDPIAILTAPYWVLFPEGLLWRPITSLTLNLDWRIGGGGPFSFHLVNLALHAAVTALWFLLVRRLIRRESLALVAALLFAVHPLHTEAVTWVSGRAELLAAGFGLGALLAAQAASGRARWWTPVLALLAVGSKESAAAVPILIFYTRWAFDRRNLRRDSGILGASLGAVLLYAVLRRAVLGTWAGPVPDAMDNPMTGLGFFSRLPTALDVAGRYLALVLWPIRLSFDYSTPVLNVLRGVTPHLLLGLLALACLLYLGWRRARAAAGWGAGWTLLTFAPASNFFVVIGTIMGERLVYFPSAGLLLVLAAAGVALEQRLAARSGSRARLRTIGPVRRAAARLGPVVLALVLLGCGARTWLRNRDYRDELTTMQAGARAAPESPKMRYNYALQLNRAGRHDESLREAAEALRLNPASREARDVMASSLELSSRQDEAIAFLLRELPRDPKDRASRRRLVELLEIRGQRARADSVLEAGVREDPGEVEWFVRAATLAQDAGEFARAAELWRRALKLAPNAADAPLRLAYCLLSIGDAAAARDVYAELLRRAPDSAEAANGLAWSLLETRGDPADAVRWAERATSASAIAPYFDTLARAYLAAGRKADAVSAATRAVTLDPDDPVHQALLREARRGR
jgi:tetratricopeptide (TPR) repeat protein